MAVVSDRFTIDSTGYQAELLSAQDYYPFGLAMPGRSLTREEGDYRYGFNGKERDPEGLGGGGSTYDYGFRIYNPGIGKFLSVDPLSRGYPSWAPYSFAMNIPIAGNDLDGLEFNPRIEAQIIHNESIKIAEMTGGDYREIDAMLHKYYRTGSIAGATGGFFLVFGATIVANNWFSLLYNPAWQTTGTAATWGLLLDEEFPGPVAVDNQAQLLRRAIAYTWESVDAIQGVGRRATRGGIFEEALAYTRYKSLTWARTIKSNFAYIDFFDESSGLAISLKSTKAQSGFSDIYDNIKNITGSYNRETGKYLIEGREFSKVEIHIAVPEGYNQSSLSDVITAAEKGGIEVKIFETTVTQFE